MISETPILALPPPDEPEPLVLLPHDARVTASPAAEAMARVRVRVVYADSFMFPPYV